MECTVYMMGIRNFQEVCPMARITSAKHTGSDTSHESLSAGWGNKRAWGRSVLLYQLSTNWGI
jgi:hypothetical protein